MAHGGLPLAVNGAAAPSGAVAARSGRLKRDVVLQFPELFWLKTASRRTWGVHDAEVMDARGYDQWHLLRLRALVFLGFWTCLDCAGLAELEVSQIQLRPNDMTVTLPAAGRRLRLARLEQYCPHQAVRMWLSHSGLTDGPLFPRVLRDGQGRALLQGRALHPMGVHAMLDWVWGGIRQVSALPPVDGAMRWDAAAGWHCPDRRRLHTLAELVGLKRDPCPPPLGH